MADPIPKNLFNYGWEPRAYQRDADGLWSTNWGHDTTFDALPNFAVQRAVSSENPIDGFVWMHVTEADNPRQLVAILLRRCREMCLPYHAGRILVDRVGDATFHPTRIVFFIHDSVGFERSYAFVIFAEQLFDNEADMESTLDHVIVYQPNRSDSVTDVHQWIYGECVTTPLSAIFPRDPSVEVTISEEMFPSVYTEFGVEYEWDPVHSREEAWSGGPWDALFANYFDYSRVEETGDLACRFHYRDEICSEARLRDVVEYMYRFARFGLQRQYADGPMHPVRRSVRGSDEYPAPERVVILIHKTRFVVVIPADVLFARETTVERALASTWVFGLPEAASEDWVEALSDPEIELLPDTVWDEVIEAIPEPSSML